MITVLCGGVGAAKFLEGLIALDQSQEIVAITNVGDDDVMHGLYICPDLDTITYTLSGAVNHQTGWGLANESWRTMERLKGLGGKVWFQLGDLDLATHLFRSERLREGATLEQVTKEISDNAGLKLKLLPATNDKIRTKLELVHPSGETESTSFQEYFVKYQHKPIVKDVFYVGSKSASLSPSVIEALEESERIIIAPSNPILSIGPILAIPKIAETIARRRSDVVAISPIVDGKALKGPADKVLEAFGYPASALGVAQYYRDYISRLIIDLIDSNSIDQIESLGVRVVATNTIMTTIDSKISLAALALTSYER
ncbi:2-phospho-L-lactate transferase [Acidithrix sp. C25]|uniref:2-phospho-L-lactate transferase n=1 Tax=Acidithrix sp. C25 TaxID=1671482 RepID=UPI00191BA7CD|nr:2-phospho-L-lactate transferase [Acidithrix sp. C25]CAG4921034.1 unnamed protein product [Acidithrix sp. C25]